MWIILLIILTGCATTERQPYGFAEAMAQYDNRPSRQSAEIVPLPYVMPPPLYETIEPYPYAPSWTMLRTPSGALYHRYGNMLVSPHGDIYTVY